MDRQIDPSRARGKSNALAHIKTLRDEAVRARDNHLALAIDYATKAREAEQQATDEAAKAEDYRHAIIALENR